MGTTTVASLCVLCLAVINSVNGDCDGSGFYVDPTDCSKFYTCLRMICPEKFYFNGITRTCEKISEAGQCPNGWNKKYSKKKQYKRKPHVNRRTQKRLSRLRDQEQRPMPQKQKPPVFNARPLHRQSTITYPPGVLQPIQTESTSNPTITHPSPVSKDPEDDKKSLKVSAPVDGARILTTKKKSSQMANITQVAPEEKSDEVDYDAFDDYGDHSGCDPEYCSLPDCRCAGSDIPGGLSPDETPNIVTLTFDDGIHKSNFDYYQELEDLGLKNPNGCSAKFTFYVSGDSVDYDMVSTIHSWGHEIGSHTISHKFPDTYWAYAGYQGYKDEVVGMRDMITDRSGVPSDEIVGMRVPFLQIGGDGQFSVLKDYGFRYDTSMLAGPFEINDEPLVWPFTMDHPIKWPLCNSHNCPSKSYPGLWEVPLSTWFGGNAGYCGMADGCDIHGSVEDVKGYLWHNYHRHQQNKAPLGIFIHYTWFRNNEANFQALKEFLGELSDQSDTWIVSVSQMLDWVQYPTPLGDTEDLHSLWSC